MSRDLRYACRVLWRTKAFSGAAVLTLALGLAGTTVMFTLVHGVLLRPLPVADQDQLLLSWRDGRISGASQYPFGNREIDAIGDASQLLQSVAGVTRNGVSRSVITDDGTSAYANVGLITGRFFDVLGVQPTLGRTIEHADDNESAEPVVVISHGLWQRRYGGARDIVGRRVALDESTFTIIGVMPPDLDYPVGVEIWRTTSSVPADGPFGDAARREVNLIGRMHPGVTIEQAASEIVSLNSRVNVEAPADGLLRDFVPVVRPFRDVVIGDVRPTMLALFGAVGLVLLIASANVANLLLMRGEARRTEVALRTALGAGRNRILRQVLAESMVLSVLAGVAGLIIAAWSLPALLVLVPDGLPRIESIRIDRTVMGFALATTFLTSLVAGFAPGVFALRADLMAPLRSGANRTLGSSAARGRRTLVVAQVALAVTVLAAAGLLIRSVLNLQAIDLGLDEDRLVLLDLHLPPAKYAEREQRALFLESAIEQLESLPAIAAATPVNVPPFSDRGWDVPRITAEGQAMEDAAANPSLNLESLHPNYFETLEVDIIQGRPFTTGDREGTVAVAIVSDDVATRLWPQGDAIGKRVKMGAPDSKGRWLEVVGVAAPTRYRTVTTPRPTLYLPAAQFQMTAAMLVVRSTAPLELLTSIANARIRSVDPAVHVMRVTPFTELLDRPLARPRFTAFLLTVFGGVALLLAAVGLYAVMTAYVRQRDRELALRRALGATTGMVQRLVLTETMRLAGLGSLIGIAGALAAARYLRGALFEVSAQDPVTLASAALLLIAAAAVASYGPLRRTSRVDVATMLRGE